MWNNWDFSYRAAQSNLSALGNRRLEMVAFGYHHPLMPLIGERDIRMQLRLHRLIHGQTWFSGGNTGFSRGLFPPETAFSTRMIPALEAEGIEWVLVDNIHFDRACVGYPHTNASNLFQPNRADQINPCEAPLTRQSFIRQFRIHLCPIARALSDATQSRHALLKTTNT